ncbi:hypothetical protein BC941DRAFT_418473 [Chlamydoabsidia padenii]|nr:hypothetical protein BC941DRAFT_418473 [Chlamydoabsidia padenii]
MASQEETPHLPPVSTVSLNDSSASLLSSTTVTNDTASIQHQQQPFETAQKPDALNTTDTNLANNTPVILPSSDYINTVPDHSTVPPMTLSSPVTSQMQRSASLAVSSSLSSSQSPSMMGPVPAQHNGYPGPYRPTPYGRPPMGQFERPPMPGPPIDSGKYYYGPGTPRPQYRPSPRPNYQPQPTLYGRSQQMMMSTSYSTMGTTDNNYLPESSVLAASQAGQHSSSSNTFPALTMENLQQLRTEAQTSNEPQKLLDLAKFMMEMVPVVGVANEKDPKRARKLQDTLVTEAQRIVKKLATHGGGLGKTGYAEAQFYLADCYGGGKLGLAVDPDRAFSLYLQGSKQNHPACTYRVAVCYEMGAGTKKDSGHAIQFFRKAAHLGDGRAMYKLSLILLRGTLGQAKNPREGMSWLERAAAQATEDHPQPIHDLGVAFEKEGIPSVIPDLNYARDLFTKAAQYGYAPSQFKLGLAYENGFLNCPIDPRRSIAWYSKAAEQGDLESELALSGWYLTGATNTMDGSVILSQNDVEAYLWARKAADRGYAKAEYAVGYYTETGVGTKQNLDEARKWYMRAAAQNNRRAMQRLSELKKHGSLQQRRNHTRDRNGRSNEKDSDCSIM